MQCEAVFLKTYRSTIFCSDACREMPRSEWAPVRLARELARRKREREIDRIRRKGLPLFQQRVNSLNSNYGVRLIAADLEGIMLVQEWHCVLCNLHLQGNAWEIDHIIPVKSGGPTSTDNLQILCSKCNKGKWTMPVQDYIAHCTAVADFARMQARRRQHRHSETQLVFLHAAVV
jgi:5-methylcytosine-specific restriction endonuclease McrA